MDDVFNNAAASPT